MTIPLNNTWQTRYQSLEQEGFIDHEKTLLLEKHAKLQASWKCLKEKGDPQTPKKIIRGSLFIGSVVTCFAVSPLFVKRGYDPNTMNIIEKIAVTVILLLYAFSEFCKQNQQHDDAIREINLNIKRNQFKLDLITKPLQLIQRMDNQRPQLPANVEDAVLLHFALFKESDRKLKTA